MGRREYYEEEKTKKIALVFSMTLILSMVIFLTVFVMYNKKLKKDAQMSIENLGKLTDIVPNDEIEETSYSKDLSYSNYVSNTIENTVSNESKNTSRNIVNTTPIKAEVENIAEDETVEEPVKELSFAAPVSGEIIKDFAMESLIYSTTLEEWTTHSGIDIKADKTSIVMASESGKIESIKNDPRYGLTVVIKHDDGYKTIYSNLLSTEFVNEGDEVDKGQTIATVGDSASFEVMDEAHLHFEMYKDGELVNPTIYLK